MTDFNLVLNILEQGLENQPKPLSHTINSLTRLGNPYISTYVQQNNDLVYFITEVTTNYWSVMMWRKIGEHDMEHIDQFHTEHPWTDIPSYTSDYENGMYKQTSYVVEQREKTETCSH